MRQGHQLSTLFRISFNLNSVDFNHIQVRQNFSINRDMKFITRESARVEKMKIRAIKSVLYNFLLTFVVPLFPKISSSVFISLYCQQASL